MIAEKGASNKKETNGAAAISEETPPAETPDETVQDSVAERARAVEALCSLARSGGGGGSGSKKGRDGRSAALAAMKAGGAQAQGHQRLQNTAEFFLETGFFAPADGGGWVGRYGCSTFVLKRGCTHVVHGISPVTIDSPMLTVPERSLSRFHPPGRQGGEEVVWVVVVFGCHPMKYGIHINAVHSQAATQRRRRWVFRVPPQAFVVYFKGEGGGGWSLLSRLFPSDDVYFQLSAVHSYRAGRKCER